MIAKLKKSLNFWLNLISHYIQWLIMEPSVTYRYCTIISAIEDLCNKLNMAGAHLLLRHCFNNGHNFALNFHTVNVLIRAECFKLPPHASGCHG